MNRKREFVIIAGQTPPPLGGQAVMIATLLEGKYKDVELLHVRMEFSRNLSDRKTIQGRKILEVARVVLGIIKAKVKTRARILYYPPSGPEAVPVLRDIAILLATRWLFDRTVFHFHAAGLPEIYPRFISPIRFLFRRAFFYPDLTIHTSPLSLDDGTRIRAKSSVVIPNGVADESVCSKSSERQRSDRTGNILFIGVICESKGAGVLLDAAKLLAKRGLDFRLRFMGSPQPVSFRQALIDDAVEAGIADRLVFLGTLSGEEKSRELATASVLCFPTHFESESFGLVIIEAFSFGLPVVATRWRGIPTVVDDASDGFLVPIKDPMTTADKLETLILNPSLCEEMGRNARAKYVAKYSSERFKENMDKAFSKIVETL